MIASLFHVKTDISCSLSLTLVLYLIRLSRTLIFRFHLSLSITYKVETKTLTINKSIRTMYRNVQRDGKRGRERKGASIEKTVHIPNQSIKKEREKWESNREWNISHTTNMNMNFNIIKKMKISTFCECFHKSNNSSNAQMFGKSQ